MGRYLQLFDQATYDEQMSSELGQDEVVDFFRA